ncbi:MAG: hypothetical protein WBA57_00540 [Elainellaceae cyanobacterium]
MKSTPQASGLVSIVSHSLVALSLTVAIAPMTSQRAMAQSRSNFGVVQLSAASRTEHPLTQGYTQGSVPLAAIATHDINGNRCVGFAETEPDHVLEVQQTMGQTVIRVNSDGNDTTLLIQDEQGRVWCGDDTGRSADATIRINRMEVGEYRVWVGSFDAAQSYNYSLDMQ